MHLKSLFPRYLSLHQCSKSDFPHYNKGETVTSLTKEIKNTIDFIFFKPTKREKKKEKEKSIACLHSDLIEVLSVSTGEISFSCCVSYISGAFFTSFHLENTFAESAEFEHE